MRLKTKIFHVGDRTYHALQGLVEARGKSCRVSHTVVETAGNKTVVKYVVSGVADRKSKADKKPFRYQVYWKTWKGKGRSGTCQVYLYADKDVAWAQTFNKEIPWDEVSLIKAWGSERCLAHGLLKGDDKGVIDDLVRDEAIEAEAVLDAPLPTPVPEELHPRRHAPSSSSSDPFKAPEEATLSPHGKMLMALMRQAVAAAVVAELEEALAAHDIHVAIVTPCEYTGCFYLCLEKGGKALAFRPSFNPKREGDFEYILDTAVCMTSGR